MDARDRVFRRRQIIAEGRMQPLALAQHLLVDQRRLGEILQPQRQFLLAIDAAMQRRASGDIAALALPAGLPVGGEDIEAGEIGALDEHCWRARAKKMFRRHHAARHLLCIGSAPADPFPSCWAVPSIHVLGSLRFADATRMRPNQPHLRLTVVAHEITS